LPVQRASACATPTCLMSRSSINTQQTDERARRAGPSLTGHATAGQGGPDGPPRPQGSS
jgi:hypothetical protein